MNKKKKKMTDLKEGIELRKRSSQAISVRVGFLGLSVGNLYGIVHALQFVSIGVGSSGNGTSSDSLSISCGMNEMKNEETKCEAADLLYVQEKRERMARQQLSSQVGLLRMDSVVLGAELCVCDRPNPLSLSLSFGNWNTLLCS